MDSFFENVAGILSSASESTLGILGLMILCLSVLALFFFHKEDWKVKGSAFLMLFVGIFTFGYAITVNNNLTQVEPNIVGIEPEQESEPEPIRTPERVQISCGEHWSDWNEVGGGAGNPCPSGCERGREVGQSYRSVGLLPPRPQIKHKFQCWRYEYR